MTVRLRISGKVQGVWYRASAKDEALRLALKGKVWNESNGDVGAILQGTKDQIDDFVAWCKKGPPLARVEEVRLEWVEDKVVFQSFEISRGEY